MAAAPAAGDRGAMPENVAPTDFEALEDELEVLRSSHRAERARRLRDARVFGSPGDNDDVLAVLEELAIEEARIARLEELVRRGPVADVAFDGRAGLGCVVRVADEAGRTTDYELIRRRAPHSSRHEVTVGSPVGKALVGARPGDRVEVALPDGRARGLRVLDVSPAPAAEAA
jgi:transcription elongation factor GreA